MSFDDAENQFPEDSDGHRDCRQEIARLTFELEAVSKKFTTCQRGYYMFAENAALREALQQAEKYINDRNVGKYCEVLGVVRTALGRPELSEPIDDSEYNLEVAELLIEDLLHDLQMYELELKNVRAGWKLTGDRVDELARDYKLAKDQLNEMGHVPGGVNWHRAYVESQERASSYGQEVERLKEALDKTKEAWVANALDLANSRDKAIMERDNIRRKILLEAITEAGKERIMILTKMDVTCEGPAMERTRKIRAQMRREIVQALETKLKEIQ